ncbi:hypothetical protein Aoki45_01010 [Algoriphagus sp. oki45]|uniref:hypothetical protein n=1 Tax=Algoriphagus sp. oki45 TaxID=3067294 RepID=UPI0027ED13D8|nr:hypothetical protein Aoki45_01010 [Algoriphagus sp. oki45]
MKILFITYYFDPYTGVGAKRVSYWANEIFKVSNFKIMPTVITATNPIRINEYTYDGPNVIFIPDNKKPIFNSLINFDPGYSWYFALRDYFNVINTFDYEYVILSGNPFLHFYISRYIKSKFGSKIVLDFRDPFANNPLFFRSHWLKKIIKKHLEKLFINNSDLVITVNKYCLKLLELNSTSNTLIIENGYDERVLNFLKKVEFDGIFVEFVYCGKISLGRDSLWLKKIVESDEKFRVHYFGDDFHKIEKHNRIIIHGFKDYDYVMSYINSCHFGIILSTGNEFESTTKIFDYIGLKKNIVVLSDRPLTKGSIFDLSLVYKKIFFFSSLGNDFTDFVGKVINQNVSVDVEEFSRLEGLKRLIFTLNNYNKI